MTIQVLYVRNDTILDLEDLTNELTGQNINNADVSVTLRDAAGVEVAGEIWPKTMNYVANSNGVYRAMLGYALALVVGNRYYATIAVDAGAGLRAAWTVECVARARG